MNNDIKDYLVSENNRQTLMDAIQQIAEAGIDFKTRENCVNYADRNELIQIAESMPITNEGNTISQLINDYKTIADKSLNFGSKKFMAQPDNGLAMANIMGELGQAFLQQNLVNYEYSPMATILEISLLTKIREIIGFPLAENHEYLAVKTGGAFVMGGYNANLSGLLIAREKLKEKLRKEGRMFNPRRTKVLAAIPYAHYSLRRSLDILGLGNKDLTQEQLKENHLDYEAVYGVNTYNYKLDLEDLEKKIILLKESGDDIMAIYAIAGESRAMGFDQLRKIAELGKKYNIWVHVDACQGGQCIFNKEIKRQLLDGIELCDSISIDPHKSFLLSYNLSAFFVKNTEDLYLLPKGSTIISNDDDALGKFTPAIGSKSFMSLKFWLFLRNAGLDRIAEEIYRRHQLAIETVELTKNYKDILVLNPNPDFNAVMVMYIPKEEKLLEEQINSINKKIHEKINNSGKFFLHSFPSKDDLGLAFGDNTKTVYPLRFMFGNPLTTIEDVKACLEEIIRIGSTLVENEQKS